MFNRLRTELGKFFFHPLVFLTETGSLEGQGREKEHSEKNNYFILLTLAKFTIVLTFYFK